MLAEDCAHVRELLTGLLDDERLAARALSAVALAREELGGPATAPECSRVHPASVLLAALKRTLRLVTLTIDEHPAPTDLIALQRAAGHLRATFLASRTDRPPPPPIARTRGDLVGVGVLLVTEPDARLALHAGDCRSHAGQRLDTIAFALEFGEKVRGVHHGERAHWVVARCTAADPVDPLAEAAAVELDPLAGAPHPAPSTPPRLTRSAVPRRDRRALDAPAFAVVAEMRYDPSRYSVSHAPASVDSFASTGREV